LDSACPNERGSGLIGTASISCALCDRTSPTFAENSDACEIESPAESRRRRLVGQARRHQEGRAQRRLEGHVRVDEREAARGDGLDQAQGKARAQVEGLIRFDNPRGIAYFARQAPGL